MFREDDLESPRVSSPWDSFLAPSPSEAGTLESITHMCAGVPKLAPEVEEGNVEYKLKLTDISPARFARLVTQLKWRLLEGRGQAYYELGVADSGALIGLSRPDLEQSLETLEMMAGEIGASVIVVKEIEVPPAMVTLADKVSEYIDPETGEWTHKMVNKRSRALVHYDPDVDSASATDTSLTDLDEPSSDIATPVDSLDATPVLSRSHRLLTSNPERPTAQSSPFIAPIDDDLALFSMEPEPGFDLESNDAILGPESTAELPSLLGSTFSLSIEISSVYKPRPARRRPAPSAVGAGTFGSRGVKMKVKEKKPRPWHQHSRPRLNSVDDNGSAVPVRQEARALQRRLARDKRREEKRLTLIAQAEAHSVPDGDDSGVRTAAQAAVVLPVEADETAELVAGLNKLLVDVQSVQAEALGTESEYNTDAGDLNEPGIQLSTNVLKTQDTQVPTISKEPRLIVEALVVRKMSIEEAFLPFGGISLN